MSSLNSSSHHQRRESSSKTNNKRGSINIWINRMRNSNHSLDDCSSLSSLSTAWVLDTSSSFYSSSTREFASDGSFDLSLLEESDDDNDNDDDMSSASTASSSSSESSAQQHNEPRRQRPQQQQNADWRWDSDPNLPLQRDLGSKIDTPVLPPIRSKSNAGAAKRRASTAARFMMQQQRKNLLTISKRTQSLKSLLQKPRMPRRQLSNASSQLLEAAQQLKKEQQPMEQHQDVTEATTEHEEVTPVEAATATRRPSNAQLTFSERLRRFPMDLPTRQRQRKLPARALRIQRVTRPCPAVTEQSNTLLVVPTKER